MPHSRSVVSRRCRRRGASRVLALAAPLAAAAPRRRSGATAAGATPRPADGRAGRRPRRPPTKQIQKALGIKADGVMGPQTRARDQALPARARPQGRRRRRPGHARGARPRAARRGPLARLRRRSATPATVLAKIAAVRVRRRHRPRVSRDGRYRGKYQFSQATWEALGGTGDPAEADEATQDAYRRGSSTRERGAAPWPACSPRTRRSSASASVAGASRIRSTRAGVPAATALAGTSLVTTRVGADHAVVADGDAAQDAGAVADPAVASRRARRACRCPAGGSGARPRRRRGRSRSASRGRRSRTRARSRRAGRRRSCTPGRARSWRRSRTRPRARGSSCRGRATTSGRAAAPRRGRSRA